MSRDTLPSEVECPKCEALNLFNHPQLRAPNTVPTDSSFGSTVGTNQANYARRIQLSVKYRF